MNARRECHRIASLQTRPGKTDAELEDACDAKDANEDKDKLSGEVKDEGGEPRAAMDIALIDPRGHVHQGRVARGNNPVLICFELFLEETRMGEGLVA